MLPFLTINRLLKTPLKFKNYMAVDLPKTKTKLGLSAGILAHLQAG
jgi:hypothetical protein